MCVVLFHHNLIVIHSFLKRLDVDWSWFGKNKMEYKIGHHQRDDSNENNKGNKCPLWERFPRHLSSQGTHDQLLKFGEG